MSRNARDVLCELDAAGSLLPQDLPGVAAGSRRLFWRRRRHHEETELGGVSQKSHTLECTADRNAFEHLDTCISRGIARCIAVYHSAAGEGSATHLCCPQPY